MNITRNLIDTPDAKSLAANPEQQIMIDLNQYICKMRDASRQKCVAIDYGEFCAHVADELQTIIDNKAIDQ